MKNKVIRGATGVPKLKFCVYPNPSPGRWFIFQGGESASGIQCHLVTTRNHKSFASQKPELPLSQSSSWGWGVGWRGGGKVSNSQGSWLPPSQCPWKVPRARLLMAPGVTRGLVTEGHSSTHPSPALGRKLNLYEAYLHRSR